MNIVIKEVGVEVIPGESSSPFKVKDECNINDTYPQQ